MKTLLTLLFVFIFSAANAQTKILDSNVDWGNRTITIFLSDSLFTSNSVCVQLGTEYQTNDIFNETSLIIGTDLPIGDKFVIPLANVSAGIYYVDVKITTSSGVQEMEFQTSN
ncbi:MAG: hypothetical protein LH473_03535 [Chitinophagales bacterium]|nr:hypothetical protein [Chitinophagales bacterium]